MRQTRRGRICKQTQKKEINMSSKRVAVYGGASPRPGERAYQEAEHLGCLLGAAGYTVLNGGYIGTMEAVSKGAAEAGGQVIGVTCKEIEKWRRVGVNPYVHHELCCQTLSERLDVLIHDCDAAIALPGGIGTLAEILYLWNHLIIQAVPPKPFILIGDSWKVILETLFIQCDGYIPAAQQGLLQMVPDADSAIRILLDA